MGWSPPGYGPGPWMGPPRRDGQAIGALVTGLLSIPCAGIIGVFLGITGVVLGIVSLRRIAASEGRYDGRGMAIAGIVLGSIGIVIGLAFFVYTTFINPEFVTDLLDQMTTTTTTPR